MKFIKIVAFVLVSLLGTSHTFAQDVNPCKAEALVGLAGRVMDEKGNSVEGAKVRVLGYKQFAMTDEDGFFEIDLKAPQGSEIRILVFKKGYETQDQYQLLGGLPVTLRLDSPTK